MEKLLLIHLEVKAVWCGRNVTNYISIYSRRKAYYAAILICKLSFYPEEGRGRSRVAEKILLGSLRRRRRRNVTKQ